MTAYQEEIFGPVLCVLYADTLDEAIKIINEYHLQLIVAIHGVMVLPFSLRVVQLPVNSNMR